MTLPSSASTWGGAGRVALPPGKEPVRAGGVTSVTAAKSPGLFPTNSKAPGELSIQEGSGKEFPKTKSSMKG